MIGNYPMTPVSNIMDYELRRRIAYFVQYFQRMHWLMSPEDIINMLADDVYDSEGQYAWNTLMNARNYLLQQRYGQSYARSVVLFESIARRLAEK